MYNSSFMSLYLIRTRNISEWLSNLTERFATFLPQENNVAAVSSPILSRQSKNNFPSPEVFRRIRSFNPFLKDFLFPSQERVAIYFQKEIETQKPEANKSPALVIGVKGCDIRPLLVYQNMFSLKDFIDPFFQERLSQTIIITADCPVPETTCFCNLVGVSPHGAKEVDGNISVIEEGLLLEVFTEKGKDLIKPEIFESAQDRHLQERKRNREVAENMLKEINPRPLPDNLPKRIEAKKEKEFWETKKKKCVECFGCLYICPTCFCFLLSDFPTDERYERLKSWDACYMASYARVGGGLNPRPLFYQRFRNRFHCKFMNTYYDFNFFACSGCGRCYKVCAAKIDLRDILLEI